MASAAIGTSHLIQSTRAGASFGYELLCIVILVNILKYPFIEYGYRYTYATGNNLIEGYNKLGRVFLYLFFIITIFATIGATTVLSFITANIAKTIIAPDLDIKIWLLIILVTCTALIFIGHYNLLDNSLKIIMIILLITTFFAFALSFKQLDITKVNFFNSQIFQAKNIPFIIALMGWMPGPIELSVWHSLWVEAKKRSNPQLNISYNQTKFDFNLGYALMILTAIMFISLGANIMYSNNISFPDSGVAFTARLIDVYAATIGDFAYPIIATCAFACMFSTTLTLIDIYPRTIAVSIKTLYPKLIISLRSLHQILILISVVITLIIVSFYSFSFKQIIDFVTISAFLSAPIFAFMNLKLITSSQIPDQYRISKFLMILSVVGLVYLVGFSLFYLKTL